MIFPLKNSALTIIFFIAVISLQAQQEASIKKITFTPQWTPQAQFAGYYMAREKGFYKKEGLEVTIKHAGPHYPAAEALTKGKADFITLFLSTGIKVKGSGKDIVNISQISQESALTIVARKTSGIKTPKDLDGKRFGLWESDFQEVPKAFFHKKNVKPRIIPIASGVNLFLWGGLDAVIAMSYNEYHTILNHGINEDELTVFYFSKCGMNIPEDGIYCMESTLKKDKELCKKFVDASIEGWKYAAAHQKETLDVVCGIMKETHTPVNLSHQKWMLARILEVIFPGNDKSKIGSLSKEQYDETARILLDSKTIKKIPPYTDFYKPEQ
jgi:NitT/TauT family transport system substrate-binding protein